MAAALPYTTGCKPAPAVVPGGQTLACSFPVAAANGKGTFTTYPPEYTEDADDALLHTYASFREEPVSALSANRDGTWTLCVPVPLPSAPNPTLLSLDYLVKYATTGDEGNATVQTDVLLTTTSLPGGVTTASTVLGVYRASTGYAPRVVDQDAARCLATTLGVKCNGGGEQWSHFVDAQHVGPNVRVRGAAQLYVLFNVAEYPTALTARSLSVEVSATWQKEEVELKAKAEEERKAKEAADKLAQEVAERKAREAEEKQAREEERQARNEARQARQQEAEERAEAKKAREEARQWMEEERRARAEDREARAQAAVPAKPSVEAAPGVADDQLQELIKETMAKHGMEPCPAGFAWVKNSKGYTCKGGSHHVSFEQLGMK